MSHHYLRFDDVHYRYPNGYEALCGVSFRITHGEKGPTEPGNRLCCCIPTDC